MFEYGILENTPQLLAIEMKGELTSSVAASPVTTNR